jgi:hypothetical protein
MNKILLAASAAAAFSWAMARRPPQTPAREKNAMQWQGTYCPLRDPEQRIVETAKDWDRLWSDIGLTPPQADLSRYFAAAVFLGVKPTGGYVVLFEDPVEEKSDVRIGWRVKLPKGFVTEALTRPYAVRLYPKSSKIPRLVPLP